MSKTEETPGAESPIAEVHHQTLDELLSRDPLDLADADIEKIVSVLRSQRDKWALEEAKPKAPKGGKRPAAASDLSVLDKEFL